MSAGARVISSAWAPVLVLLILVAGIFLGDHLISSHAYDQNHYHIQVIRQFEAQWPAPDFSDYAAATGPLYHLVLVALGEVFGNDLETLRVLSVLFGIGLVVAVAGVAGRLTAPRAAAFLAMPLAASIYVVGSATHVHTDDFAWMAASLCIGCVLVRKHCAPVLMAASVAMLAAVATRQNFIWLAGPVLLAGLLDLARERNSLGWKRLLAHVAVILPSVGLLVTFVVLWGGLVPPHFQEFHVSGGNWIAPGYALGLLGLYAPFFLLAVPEPRTLLRGRLLVPCLAALVGALLVLLPVSAPDVAAGRTGGPLWTLSGLWVVADRSIPLAFFAAFGAGSLAFFGLAVFSANATRGWLILLCALAATTVTQVANVQTFQRYFDTPTLVFLCWTLAMILGERRESVGKASGGPALLGVILASLLVVRMVGF